MSSGAMMFTNMVKTTRISEQKPLNTVKVLHEGKGKEISFNRWQPVPINSKQWTFASKVKTKIPKLLAKNVSTQWSKNRFHVPKL